MLITIFVCMHRMGRRYFDPNQAKQLYSLYDVDTPVADPQDPEKIQSCYCAQLVNTVYLFNSHHLCQDCYDYLDPGDQDLYEDPPTYFLCGRIQTVPCRLCDIQVAGLQPATSCP